MSIGLRLGRLALNLGRALASSDFSTVRWELNSGSGYWELNSGSGYWELN